MPGAPAIVQQPQKKRQIDLKIKAPYKGLNSIDSLAEMSPDYAVQFTNFIATPFGPSPRMGYEKFATGFTSSVTSMFAYNGRSAGNNKLFAVSGGSFYDVTAGGAIGSAVVSGQSTSATYWQYSSQSTSAPLNYIVCVNGVNAPQLYNGSTWTTCSQVSSPSSPGQFSQNDQNGNAVSISAFMDVINHAERWWFVSENSTIAYYIGIAAVGGQLEAFDFGPQFPRGGNLQKLASWTIDTGAGVDYILVAISNKGDIVLYSGNDPSQAATFTLIGQYQLGAPIGQRCTIPLAGDIGYLSRDGLYALSKYLQSARVDIQSAMTYAITPTIQSEFIQWGSTVGWDLVIQPTQEVLLVNVPQGAQTTNIQFCYNMVTQGWSQFTGWPAQCFCLFNEQLYFGGTDHVGIAFTGYTDAANSSGSGGSNVIATALQAFSDLGYQGMKKVTGVKPYLLSGQTNPSVSVGINTDFNLNSILGSATATPPSGAVWDSAVWDSSNWIGAQVTPNQWYMPQSWPGEYIAITVSISAVSPTTWAATNYLVVPGASFG